MKSIGMTKEEFIQKAYMIWLLTMKRCLKVAPRLLYQPSRICLG